MRAIIRALLGAAAALAAAAPAAATVIASSSFDTGPEGWAQGEFDGPNGQPSAGVDYLPGEIAIPHDNYDIASFLAPAAYLGNLSAARGGTLSYDLTDAFNDGQADGSGTAWSAYVSVYGANGRLIYGGLEDRLPSRTGFSHFQIHLTAATFYTEGNLRTGTGPTLGGRRVTQQEFDDVFADVARLGIPADFSSGDDSSRLDNVVLTAAVPEPAAWSLLIGGFALTGVALRRSVATLSKEI